MYYLYLCIIYITCIIYIRDFLSTLYKNISVKSKTAIINLFHLTEQYFLNKRKKYQAKKIVHNQIFNRYLTLQKKVSFLNLKLTSYQQKNPIVLFIL